MGGCSVLWAHQPRGIVLTCQVTCLRPAGVLRGVHPGGAQGQVSSRSEFPARVLQPAPSNKQKGWRRGQRHLCFLESQPPSVTPHSWAGVPAWKVFPEGEADLRELLEEGTEKGSGGHIRSRKFVDRG